MTKTALLAASALVALSFCAQAGTAPPRASGKGAFHITFPVQGMKTLYNQRDNDNTIGIVSQNFESTYDAYDAQGADDFTIDSAPNGAMMTGVIADGVYFNGSGPADTYNVYIYKNKNGKPGKTIKACENVPYTDTGVASPQIKCKAKLAEGTYFVSVQANMVFGSNGEWGWTTNNAQRGVGSLWQNPGDGYLSGCTTYTPTPDCIQSGEGLDFSFAILGKKL